MSEPDRADRAGEHPAEGGGPGPDTTEQGAGGGPAQTNDGPEAGDVYVPV